MEIEHVGLQLKSLLKQRGLTAAAVARKAGIGVANLSRILNGQINPSFESIRKLASALEISLETLQPRPQISLQSAPLVTIFALEDTDLSPDAAAELLLSAAVGGWPSSYTQAYLPDDIAKPTLISASQVGTRRLEVSLGIPLAYIEKGSISSLLSVISSALTGTGARLLDIQVPEALVRTFNGPAFGVRGLRDTFNKHGRPLLSCTIRPMHGLSPRLYGRTAFEALFGGVDITADPTLLHATPANPWRERFRFVAEAASAATRETNEFKTHAVNITAATVEDMIERAEWAKELDLAMVLVDPATIGWTGLQSVANWCSKNELLLCAMGSRALSGDMLSEQLQAKLLRLAGADVVSCGSPLRGNVSNRRYVTGVLGALRDDTLAQAPDMGHHTAQSFMQMNASMPAVGGGHNPWQMPRLIDAVGDNALIQCGGAIMNHPWGGQAGATACRTAVEALVQARGEGNNLSVEARAILQKAARYSPDLKQALDTYQEGALLFGVVSGQLRPTGASVIPGPSNPSPTITPFKRPEPTNED